MWAPTPPTTLYCLLMMWSHTVYAGTLNSCFLLDSYSVEIIQKFQNELLFSKIALYIAMKPAWLYVQLQCVCTCLFVCLRVCTWHVCTCVYMCVHVCVCSCWWTWRVRRTSPLCPSSDRILGRSYRQTDTASRLRTTDWNHSKRWIPLIFGNRLQVARLQVTKIVIASGNYTWFSKNSFADFLCGVGMIIDHTRWLVETTLNHPFDRS